MFDKKIVREALKRTLAWGKFPVSAPENPPVGLDTEISLLIHDVFGGEILKTRRHKKKGWHFYNRIEGERIDFTLPELEKTVDVGSFEDIPTTPEEVINYYEKVDYSAFFMKFVRAFEETVGLDKYRPEFTS